MLGVLTERGGGGPRGPGPTCARLVRRHRGVAAVGINAGAGTSAGTSAGTGAACEGVGRPAVSSGELAELRGAASGGEVEEGSTWARPGSRSLGTFGGVLGASSAAGAAVPLARRRSRPAPGASSRGCSDVAAAALLSEALLAERRGAARGGVPSGLRCPGRAESEPDSRSRGTVWLGGSRVCAKGPLPSTGGVGASAGRVAAGAGAAL